MTETQVNALPSRKAPDFTKSYFCVLGTAFDHVSMDDVLERMRQATHPLHHERLVVSTPNVNQVVAARHDASFQDSIARSDLVVADGMPLVWIARFLNVKTKRIAGSDLFEHLAKGDAGRMRVFFFGGPDGVAQNASDKLNANDKSPLIGVGGMSPGFGTIADMSSDDIVNTINATNPDFVVVALGAVKGQQWIDAVQGRLNAPAVSHLGAVVNFVAGTVKRSPKSLQVMGGEWLWRIREEPALWRRYFDDGKQLLKLMFTCTLPLQIKRVLMGSQGKQAARASVMNRPDGKLLVLTGDWDASNGQLLGDILNELTATPGNIDIRVAGVRYMDHSIVAKIIRLRGYQQNICMRFSMISAQADLRSVLRMHGAEYLVGSLPANSAKGAAVASKVRQFQQS